MKECPRTQRLRAFLRVYIVDQVTLTSVLCLLQGTEHVARGAYSNACTEKRAAGYLGTVAIARESIEQALLIFETGGRCPKKAT